MHHDASKCMQNELCKCFVHEIIKKVVLITFKGAKINEIHLPLYGGTPCISGQKVSILVKKALIFIADIIKKYCQFQNFNTYMIYTNVKNIFLFVSC